jgi:hypothetical protein
VAQNVKKMALLLSKRGKGPVLWFLLHIKFPLSVYSPEIYNLWPLFSRKMPEVCHQARPVKKLALFCRIGIKRLRGKGFVIWLSH